MFHTKEKVKPPRSLRTARLSVVKNKISTPVSVPVTEHAPTMASPKKVIKALYDYQSQSPLELSFTRGDFFHVIGRENDTHWYEACNPITNSRGVVPVSYFQVLEKNKRNSNEPTPPLTPLASNNSGINALAQQQHYGLEQKLGPEHGDDSQQGISKKMQPLYGIVLYDFQAERSDELNAKAGEPIIVIAQSNLEWFVAKPIGRLGGPGLIPVSFVEIRDAVTGQTINNVGDLMQTSAAPIPKVEEWKKLTQGYEATSFSLGNKNPGGSDPHSAVLSSSSSSRSSGKSDHWQQQQLHQQLSHSQPEDNIGLNGMENGTRIKKEGLVISVAMDSYILEGDQFWFIVYAGLNNGKHRVLYRLYEDFYDFQINLLHEFPNEAGKEDNERILPYMPGPLTHVDEEVTVERQNDLDKYCQELLALPPYLSQCSLVQDQLFGIHEGDVETDQDPRINGNDNNNNSHQQPFKSIHTDTTSTPGSSNSIPYMNEPQHPATQSTGGSNTNGKIKVKIIHKDDIIAIKVPTSSTLNDLRSKIVDRLGAQVHLQYKQEPSKERLPLDTDLDMEEAFAMSIKPGKLTVYANDILE